MEARLRTTRGHGRLRGGSGADPAARQVLPSCRRRPRSKGGFEACRRCGNRRDDGHSATARTCDQPVADRAIRTHRKPALALAGYRGVVRGRTRGSLGTAGHQGDLGHGSSAVGLPVGVGLALLPRGGVFRRHVDEDRGEVRFASREFPLPGVRQPGAVVPVAERQGQLLSRELHRGCVSASRARAGAVSTHH